MELKRLWDIDNKKIVYTEGPSGHMCQVWTDKSGNLYIYDKSKWLSYNGVSTAGEIYGPANWKEMEDQEVGYYDTNVATDLYSWDNLDKAYYKFVDYNGTVLKSGTVEEGETPTAPADPTRTGYTFTGWNPEVGPISKRTTYTAQYTINTYTLTIAVNDSDYGTTDKESITVPYGTQLTNSGAVLTAGDQTVTATPNEGYAFTGWSYTSPVTADATATASFEAVTEPEEQQGE